MNIETPFTLYRADGESTVLTPRVSVKKKKKTKSRFLPFLYMQYILLITRNHFFITFIQPYILISYAAATWHWALQYIQYFQVPSSPQSKEQCCSPRCVNLTMKMSSPLEGRKPSLQCYLWVTSKRLFPSLWRRANLHTFYPGSITCTFLFYLKKSCDLKQHTLLKENLLPPIIIKIFPLTFVFCLSNSSLLIYIFYSHRRKYKMI